MIDPKPFLSRPRRCSRAPVGRLVRLCELCLLWLWIWPLAAQAAGPGDFQPYQPPQDGVVSAPLFVLVAYAAIWIALLSFLASVWRRQRRVQEDIEDLRRQLGDEP